MRKSSWLLLGISAALVIFLGFLYVQSKSVPEIMTDDQARAMLAKMQEAVAHKNVNGIMDMVSGEPGTRVANMRVEQLRVLIARAFRQGKKFNADVSGITVQSRPNEATVEFNLDVTHMYDGSVGKDYQGHITLQMQREDVPVLLGLMHNKQWRIRNAESTGPDPSTFGDY